MASCNPQKVIQIAEQEIGYLEKRSNSQLDSKTANAGSKNYTKYNRDYMSWGAGGSINMQWCAAFVSWCFVVAYGLAAAKALLCGGLHHYTPTGANRFKKQGRYIKRGKGKPQIGDVVYFYSSAKGRIGHVGIVYKVSSSRVYTLEGNTSGASTLVTNGGGVKKKSYSLTSSYIDGYGRPNYAGIESGTGGLIALKLGDRMLENGCVGNDVVELQKALSKLGYDIGKYGADGDFGSSTEAAVKAFQKDHNLEVDGQYGSASHKVMVSLIGQPAQPETPSPAPTPIGSVLKKGSIGDEVKELQENLIKLGYNCGSYGADGEFGNATETALKEFQKKNGLEVDGEYGTKTREAIEKALKESNVENQITVLGNSVNIRKGPSTIYKSIKVVYKNDKLDSVDTSNWLCIKYGDVIGWASMEYIDSDNKNTASSLNIRKGPDTSYDIIHEVRRGYKFEKIDYSGWIPIKIDKEVCWISAKYAK